MKLFRTNTLITNFLPTIYRSKICYLHYLLWRISKSISIKMFQELWIFSILIKISLISRIFLHFIKILYFWIIRPKKFVSMLLCFIKHRFLLILLFLLSYIFSDSVKVCIFMYIYIYIHYKHTRELGSSRKIVQHTILMKLTYIFNAFFYVVSGNRNHIFEKFIIKSYDLSKL